MQGRISWATLSALLLAAIFVAATWTTIDFPLGTLGDEWAKIDAVRTGNNRYYHPLLMIEVTQFANLSLAHTISNPSSKSGELARRLPAVSSSSRPIGSRGWCCPSSAPWRQRRQPRSSPYMPAS